MTDRRLTSNIFLVIALLLAGMLTANAQQMSRRERVASSYFKSLSYLQAISAYEDVIKKDSSNVRALRNLGTSYRKVNDYTSAERVYAQVVKYDTVTAENYLYYAQSLAVNRHYEQSAEAYRKYASLRSGDSRGEQFTNAYGNLPDFFRDSTVIRVNLLNINSSQSDFSPAFYKKGLLFCSSRILDTKGVKRVFEWNQSAFLDLYYVKDTARIRPMQMPSDSAVAARKKSLKFNDDDTEPTSNDSRTLGATPKRYIDTTALFSENDPIVKPFSKAIATKYHEGPVSFFRSGDSLIFTRNNYFKGKYRKSKDGVNKLKLYSATYKINDSAWQNVRSLNFNNDNYSTGHPAIAPGDSILYFVSDMPGGLGGTDVYKSYYRNGDWSAPENLGAPINTEGNEMFPFIDSEGTLYFASDGHPGLGGLDIFKTSLTKIQIRNIGYPVNSSYDDFGLIVNNFNSTGFFSSNRRRGVSDDDIYSVVFGTTFFIEVVDSITDKLIPLASAVANEKNSLSPAVIDPSQSGRFRALLADRAVYTVAATANGYHPARIITTADAGNPVIRIRLVKLMEGCIVAGTVTDKDSRLPVEGARVIITDGATKDTLFSFITAADGKYKYSSLKGEHTYSMLVSREGYFNKPAVELSTRGNKCIYATERPYDYLKDFELEKIIIGKAIKIDNIYFDVSKYNIRKDAAVELDKIVRLMQENPDIIIELSSHTDCRASFQYNMTLSDNRAKSSADYIVSKGIKQERITGKGYGETKLVNDCGCEGKVVSRVCSEEEHQANRRTEFQVTGFLSEKNSRIENGGPPPVSVPVPPQE